MSDFAPGDRVLATFRGVITKTGSFTPCDTAPCTHPHLISWRLDANVIAKIERAPQPMPTGVGAVVRATLLHCEKHGPLTWVLTSDNDPAPWRGHVAGQNRWAAPESLTLVEVLHPGIEVQP